MLSDICFAPDVRIPHFDCPSKDQEFLSYVCVCARWRGWGKGAEWVRVEERVDKGKRDTQKKCFKAPICEKAQRKEKHIVCLSSRVQALFKTLIS